MRPPGRCICLMLRPGTTFGRGSVSPRAKWTRSLLWTAFRSMFVPGQSCLLGQRLNTQINRVVVQSNCEYTAARMGNSTFTTIRATATDTSEGRGSGSKVSAHADKEIQYSGQSIQVADPTPRH